MAIRLSALVKRFNGRAVLDGVDLDVPTGNLFGLIGLNGAGKTTVLRIALGLLRPDQGSAWVLDTPVSRLHTLSGRVGAAQHGVGLEPQLTARDNLRLHAHLHGRPRVDPSPLLKRLELSHLAGRRVARLSQGERQRLNIARALLLRPDVLLLDEPLTHLDPGAVDGVLELLAEEVRERNATILLSSHQLELVERAADGLALIHRGRVLLDGTMKSLLSATGSTLLLEVDRVDDAERLLAAHDHVEEVTRVGAESGQLRVRITTPCSAELNSQLHTAGVRVSLLAPERRTLTDLFRQAVDEDDRVDPAGDVAA